MTRERAGAVILLSGPLLTDHRARIAGLALGARLPMMSVRREFVEAGALISYGANFATMYRRAAVFVDRILKGAKPAELPVEQPTNLELVINLGTARALGLSIAPSLLVRADQVLE